VFHRLYCIVSARFIAKFFYREVPEASPVLVLSIVLGKTDIGVRIGQSTGLNVRLSRLSS